MTRRACPLFTCPSTLHSTATSTPLLHIHPHPSFTMPSQPSAVPPAGSSSDRAIQVVDPDDANMDEQTRTQMENQRINEVSFGIGSGGVEWSSCFSLKNEDKRLERGRSISYGARIEPCLASQPKGQTTTHACRRWSKNSAKERRVAMIE